MEDKTRTYNFFNYVFLKKFGDSYGYKNILSNCHYIPLSTANISLPNNSVI